MRASIPMAPGRSCAIVSIGFPRQTRLRGTAFRFALTLLGAKELEDVLSEVDPEASISIPSL